MKIEEWPITKLIEYDRNPRVNDAAVDRIAAAIHEYGFRVPILVKTDGLIIDGHLRLKAARKLNLEVVPVILADDMTDIQIKAFRLSVNKMADLASWDDELLRLELVELKELGFDMDLTGFLDEEIGLLTIDDEIPEALTDPDDVPDVPKEAITKRGDIWILGDHRVMCGDATMIDDVDKLMASKKADMVFTDPPYGVSYGEKNESLNKIGKGNRNQTPILNDSMSAKETKELWLMAFTNLHLASSDKAAYYICGPQGGDLLINIMLSIENSGWQLKHMMIWVKNNFVLGRMDYHYKHEPIMYGWKNKESHNWYGDHSQSSTWEITRPNKSELHPTMKPVELMEKAILNSSQAKNIIIDFFLGSGSTLIACEKNNRICYGMELSPHYCDVIVKRWEDYTGKTALISDL